MKYLTESDLLTLLQARVIAEGSQVAAAKALGISEAYISLLLRGKRLITAEDVLARLGVTRQVRYFLTPKTGAALVGSGYTDASGVEV